MSCLTRDVIICMSRIIVSARLVGTRGVFIGERGRGNADVEGDWGRTDPSCDMRVDRERVVERGMLPGVPGVLIGRLREARTDGDVGNAVP